MSRERHKNRRRVHLGDALDAESAAAALRAAGVDASASPVANNAPPLFAMAGSVGFSEVTVPRDSARAAKGLLRSAHRRGAAPFYRRRFGLSPYQLERGRIVAAILGISVLLGFGLMLAIAVIATR